MFTVIRLCNDAISALHSHRSGKQNFTAQVVLMLLIEASVMCIEVFGSRQFKDSYLNI